MKRRHLLTIVAVLLLFGATNAQAEPILVTITGQYPASIIGTAPPYTSQDFRFEFLTDLNPVPTRVTEPTSFTITPAVDYYVGGTFYGAFETLGVGWFDYPDRNYRGIDLRLMNWIDADWYQIVIPFPVSGFTGPVSAPTLSLLDLSGLSAGFNQRGSSPMPGNFRASAVTYSVSAISEPVPEPASLVLFGTGLVGLRAWRKRRQ